MCTCCRLCFLCGFGKKSKQYFVSYSISLSSSLTHWMHSLNSRHNKIEYEFELCIVLGYSKTKFNKSLKILRKYDVCICISIKLPFIASIHLFVCVFVCTTFQFYKLLGIKIQLIAYFLEKKKVKLISINHCSFERMKIVSKSVDAYWFVCSKPLIW